MYVGKAIKSLLNTAGYDCSPIYIPKDHTGDAVVYNIISIDPSPTKRAVSHLDTYRVQVDCYSHNFTGAVALAAGVRTALDGKTGTYNTVVVDDINFIDSGSIYDLEMNEVGIRQDYYIRIKI